MDRNNEKSFYILKHFDLLLPPKRTTFGQPFCAYAVSSAGPNSRSGNRTYSDIPLQLEQTKCDAAERPDRMIKAAALICSAF